MAPAVGIRALALVTCLVAAGPAWAAAPATAPATAPAVRKMSPLRRAYLKELASWRSIVKKPARAIRFAVTSGLSIGAGWLTNHLTGSPAAASFVSFTTGVLADRVIERLLPHSRPLGTPRPPGLLRDGTQTLVGASVAAIATPTMMHLFEHAGANAPGLFGLGAQLVLSRPLVQGMGGFTGSMIAQAARAGTAKLFSMRNAAKADEARARAD